MNIGIETTTITNASANNGDKSGVYRYFINLITALPDIMHKNDKLFLYDSYNFVLKNLSSDLYPVLNQKNVFAPAISQPRPFKLEDSSIDDIPVVRWFGKKLDRMIIRQITERMAYGAFIGKINHNLKNHKVDVFHVSETVYFHTPEIKQVATVCDIIPIRFPEFQREETVRIHMRRLRYLKKKADAIIAISENTKKDLVEKMKYDPDRIFVTPLAAENVFRPIEKSDVESLLLALSKSKLEYKKYVLFFGTLEPRKNIGILLRAYRDLKRSGLYGGKLVIAGGKGWGKIDKLITGFIQENMLEKEIICLGFLEDEILNKLINGAKMVVYPSLYEGFGLPPLESMQAGTPVITTNCSSIPEVTGNAAILFEPANIRKLKHYIQRLDQDPAFEQKFIRRGLRQAKKFSWKKTAEKTLEIYQKVLSGRVPS